MLIFNASKSQLSSVQHLTQSPALPPTRANVGISMRHFSALHFRGKLNERGSCCVPIFQVATAMMSLKEVVERYSARAKQFGEPISLAEFGLTPEQTARLFTFFDEDYHISRFMNFSVLQGKEYMVSGSPVTHVRIDEGIRSIL